MLKKVALISDIQGNYTALKLVMARIEAEKPDTIVCLGDVASGPYPCKVLAMLRDYRVHVVKGNMDDAILNPVHATDELEDPSEEDIRYTEIDQWCSAQLSTADKAYMRSFRTSILFDLADGMQLLCFHGSPYSYNDVIDENTTDNQLSQVIAGYTEEVMATGHMHHQFMRPYANTVLLNPGSVGLPRKRQNESGELCHPLIAEYAILEIVERQINVAFRTVEVPAKEFAEGILNSGMPHANWFLSQWQV